MKIKVYKHAMERWVPLDEIELFESAGWSQHAPQAKVVVIDEVIAMKAPAKNKGAAKTLDNAIEQGD